MSEIALPNTLTQDEKHELEALEARIGNGLKTFFDVGDALMKVRDSKLYRQEYGTFEDYCQQKWQMTRRRANQLIQSAEVVQDIQASTVVDKEEMGTIVPKNEGQARALKDFDNELRPVIMRLVNGYSGATGKPVTAGMIKRTGEVLLEAEHTGHVDIGNGEGSVIFAALSVKEAEATERQKQYQQDHFEKKDSRSQWKDHLSELEPEDQALVQEVTLDITSGYGGERSAQSVAFDAKKLSKTNTWQGATPEQKKEMLEERFSEKQAKSYEKTPVKDKSVQRLSGAEVQSLEVACSNLIALAHSTKALSSGDKGEVRKSLEHVNAVAERMLS